MHWPNAQTSLIQSFTEVAAAFASTIFWDLMLNRTQPSSHNYFCMIFFSWCPETSCAWIHGLLMAAQDADQVLPATIPFPAPPTIFADCSAVVAWSISGLRWIKMLKQFNVSECWVGIAQRNCNYESETKPELIRNGSKLLWDQACALVRTKCRLSNQSSKL